MTLNFDWFSPPFRDHLSFFDKLWNNGVNPIYILITYAINTPWTYLGPFTSQPTSGGYSFKTTENEWYQVDETKEAENSQTRQIHSNIIAAIAERYGYHPAVMGFVIGNEQNNMITRSNCQFWEWINDMGGRVKWYAPEKLTSTTIVDDDFGTVRAAFECSDLENMDVWGINAYRGRVDQGFDQLFDDYATYTTQGMLITEFGCPSSTRDEADKLIMLPENSKDQASYLKVHWDDIVAHSSICSGGYAFSWVDEWWKNGNDEFQDQHDARNFAFPGTYADEELYGLLAVEVNCDQMGQWATRKDRVLPRSVYYIMGQMFGAFTEIPDVAYTPINYPRCNGEWVGTENGENPDVGVPVGEQGPVAAVPMTIPPRGPEPMPVPVAAPSSSNTPDGQTPQVTTPINVGSPSVIQTPSVNNNVQSSASVVAPVSLLIVALAFL